jgi:predicted metal-dependent phosphoesterase TrpH
MRIDLHCHSKFSHDSYFEPEALIEEAINKKLDGVCFTEHYSVTASFTVEKIKVPDGFFVFRGLEISTNQGHLLVYGLRNDEWNIWARNNYPECIEVMDRVHALGGICVPAHPFRGYDSLGDYVMRIDGFDAIETHNGFNIEKANRQAIQVARRKNLPSTGGSDCHNRMQVGRAFTVFENSINTMEDLVKEIKSGSCKGVLRKED